MNEDIENAVRESLALLARDPARHDELRALAGVEDQDPAEVAAAVEALLGSEPAEPSIDGVLVEAFLRQLRESEPLESCFFDSGAAGGSDEQHIHELPNGAALVYSVCDWWRGPYPSVGEAMYVCRFPTINIWLSDDFSDELSAVPESEDCIKIEGETYRRLDDEWHSDEGGPIYVKFRGTWMDESDALDAKNAEDS